MGWKAVVVAGFVLVAALGGVGWAVSASATPPSSVIGPPVVVTPVAKESPTFEPTESPGPPAESRSPSRTPSVPTSSSAAPVPPVTDHDDEAPEIVAPQRVRPVEDDEDDKDEYPDDDAEADDD